MDCIIIITKTCLIDLFLFNQDVQVKTISSETERSYNTLKDYLSAMESAAVAYSGGVDSTLLLYAASQIPGLRLKAYTIKNAMITAGEVETAASIAEKFNVDHNIIEVDIFSLEKIISNSEDRCYHCKNFIFKKIITVAAEHGISKILEGSHSGDMNDYRPGLRALSELGVLSPLKDAGFDKNKIYELSSFLELPTSGKESYPCLATRIPYGTRLTAELLHKAERAEEILKIFGFRKIRARIHGDILRIEVDEKMIPEITSSPTREMVSDALHSEGFIYITIDLQGYRTGSMNINIEEKK